MRMRHKTRLGLEPLEDRCTPSAVGHALADDLLDSPGDGHAAVQVSQIPTCASHGPQHADSGRHEGNVFSAFARDAHGVRVLWGESAIIDGARVVTWALVSPR